MVPQSCSFAAYLSFSLFALLYAKLPDILQWVANGWSLSAKLLIGRAERQIRRERSEGTGKVSHCVGRGWQSIAMSKLLITG